jgi:hypothetical protein
MGEHLVRDLWLAGGIGLQGHTEIRLNNASKRIVLTPVLRAREINSISLISFVEEQGMAQDSIPGNCQKPGNSQPFGIISKY